MSQSALKEKKSIILEQINPDKIELLDLVQKPAWKTILIDLVKTEKMDPWNIDIVELANKYLQKINSLSGKDLHFPANAILVCAILLKFKSRVLLFSKLDDEEQSQDSQQMTEEQKKQIDELLPELQLIKSSREGKISLDDLVLGLEKIFEKNQGDLSKRALGSKEIIEFKLPFSDYDIDKLTEQIFQEIKQKADSTGLLVFSKLVETKSLIATIESFIACLFLANKNKINIWQEQFFGEIFISVNIVE